MNGNSPSSSDEGSARSRYPGTRPFRDSTNDCARFFGRTEEGEQLYLRVLSVPLLVQFGRSGLGKTSLLQAALFPRLRQKPFLPVIVRLNVLSDTLTLAVAHSIQQSCKAEELEFTEGRTDGLWELLSTTIVWRDDLLLTPVLVFDQFEEVFTLRDARFRADLATELGALVSGIVPERLYADRPGVSEQLTARPDVKIVISLREDYLGALQEFSPAIPNLFHERLRLEPLTEDEARQAIIEPAQLMAGPGEEPYWVPPFDFDPPVLDSMIAYLKGSSGVIEPFQLQLLCRHAERIARGIGRTQTDWIKLTPADFSGRQDFASVLKNFYRETLLKLPSLQRKKAGELCEDGLLDNFGHRLPLEEEQIRSEFRITTDTLSTLSRERLLLRERRLESVFYEISHDRLAESVFASRRRRLPKKIRRQILTAVTVLPVVIAVLGFGVVTINKERQNAKRLLGFLLGEKFLGEVRDVGRSTMLEQVREHVGEYDWGTFDRSAALRGLALRNAGDVERTEGNVSVSIMFFQQALEIFESSPDDLASPREAARTHERMGEALSDQGQVTKGLFHYEAAVKAWRQVVARDPGAATVDCTSLADSLVSAGELKYRMGEATLARTDLEEAIKIATILLVGRETLHDQCGAVAGKAEPYLYLNGKALEVFSRAVLLRAQVLNFKEDYEGAPVLAMEARRLRLRSASASRNALVALAWGGDGRIYDQPQRALDDYREGLKGFERLRHLDPNNRLWQRERAAMQLKVSGAIVACHESKTKDCKPMPSLEEAEATSLDAIATLHALAGIDPNNSSLKRDLAWALQDHARVLASSDRKAERLARLEESEKFYISSTSDPADAAGAEALGFLLLDKADALAALDRQAEAKATLQRSIDQLNGLIADHQDNSTYVADLSAVRQREAEILRKTGDRAGADAADREATRLNEQYQKTARSINEEADKQHHLHIPHVNEGKRLFSGGDHAGALGELKAAESPIWEYIWLRPTDFSGYDKLRDINRGIQRTQEELGNAEEATAAVRASMYAAQIAALLAPEDNEMINNMLQARHDLAVSLYENERLDEALAMVQEEVVVAEKHVQEASQSAQYAEHTWRLGDAKFGLGMIRRGLKKEGWEEAVRSALIHFQKAAEIDTKNPDYQKKVGSCRKYLAEQLDHDGLEEKASAEYRLALDAYQKALEAYRKAASISPADKEKGISEAENAIRELAERVGSVTRAKQRAER